MQQLQKVRREKRKLLMIAKYRKFNDLKDPGEYRML